MKVAIWLSLFYWVVPRWLLSFVRFHDYEIQYCISSRIFCLYHCCLKYNNKFYNRENVRRKEAIEGRLSKITTIILQLSFDNCQLMLHRKLLIWHHIIRMVLLTINYIQHSLQYHNIKMFLSPLFHVSNWENDNPACVFQQNLLHKNSVFQQKIFMLTLSAK